MTQADFLSKKQSNVFSKYLYYTGYKYWSASILPALVGLTLPFWLRPSGFSFKWFAAIEFLIATIFFHGGFSFLLAGIQHKIASSLSKVSLIKYSIICIFIACLLGLHLNENLILHQGVPKYIFIVYGLTTLFVGLLYVLPPFNFYKRMGGEIVIAEGLGMIPLLGGYLIQVGDLTRTVYLASLPIVAITGLWIWIDELSGRINDEKVGRKTMVAEFGLHFSGRYGVSAISFLVILTILLSGFSGSLSPLAMISLLLIIPLWKIVSFSWNEYLYPERMVEIGKNISVLHFAMGSIFVMSSLLTRIIGFS